MKTRLLITALLLAGLIANAQYSQQQLNELLMAARTAYTAATSAPPWSPSALSPLMWFDASDSSTVATNSGGVTNWASKAGSVYAVPQDVGDPPVYVSAALNSKAVLRFSGTEQLMFSNRVGIAENQHIFIVADTVNLQTGSRSAISGDNDGYPPNWYFADYNGANYTPGMWAPSAWRQGWTGAVQRAAVFHWGLSSALNTIQVDAQPTTSNSSSITYLNTGFGQLFVTTPDQRSAADYAEILITTNINADEIDKLNGYLSHKWGVQSYLPTDHPYKAAPP